MLVLGALLPWIKLQSGFAAITRNGVEDAGDGVWLVCLGVIAAAIGLGVFVGFKVPQFVQRSPIVLGIAGLVLGIINLVDIQDRVDSINGSADQLGVGSVGAGLYIVLIGSVLAFISGCVLRSTRDQDPYPAAARAVRKVDGAPDDGPAY